MHHCCLMQPPTSATRGGVWPSPCRRASHAAAGGRTTRQWPAGRCQRGHQSLFRRSPRQRCRRRHRRRRLALLQQHWHRAFSHSGATGSLISGLYECQRCGLQWCTVNSSLPGITVLDAVEKAAALLTVAAEAPFALDWQLPQPRLAVAAGFAVFPVCRRPVLTNTTPLSP